MATKTASAIDIPGTSAASVMYGVDVFRNVIASNESPGTETYYANSCIVYPGSTTTTGVAASTYYKLRGYNSSTKQYEVWVSTDPYSSPPSLASLLDVTYVEFNA